MQQVREAGFTDLIIAHENRGTPDALVISHVPFGPTLWLQISDIILKQDVNPQGTFATKAPHLIFENLNQKVGKRIIRILQHLFPEPKEDSDRVIAFMNRSDTIVFRNYQYAKVGKDVVLKEQGPRFNITPFKIQTDSLDQKGDVEWQLNTFTNTAYKVQQINYTSCISCFHYIQINQDQNQQQEQIEIAQQTVNQENVNENQVEQQQQDKEILEDSKEEKQEEQLLKDDEDEQKQKIIRQEIFIDNIIYVFFLLSSAVMLISLLSLEQCTVRDEQINIQQLQQVTLVKDDALQSLFNDISQASSTINIMVQTPQNLLLSNETSINDSIIVQAIQSAIDNYATVNIISGNQNKEFDEELTSNLSSANIQFIGQQYQIDQSIIIIDQSISYIQVGNQYYKFNENSISYDLDCIVQNVYNQGSTSDTQDTQLSSQNLILNRHNLNNPINTQSQKIFTVISNNLLKSNQQTTFLETIQSIQQQNISNITIQSQSFNLYDQENQKFDLNLVYQLEQFKQSQGQYNIQVQNEDQESKLLLEQLNWTYSSGEINVNQLTFDQIQIISGCDIQHICDSSHICVGIFFGN